jgi:hypothetical protein
MCVIATMNIDMWYSLIIHVNMVYLLNYIQIMMHLNYDRESLSPSHYFIICTQISLLTLSRGLPHCYSVRMGMLIALTSVRLPASDLIDNGIDISDGQYSSEPRVDSNNGRVRDRSLLLVSSPWTDILTYDQLWHGYESRLSSLFTWATAPNRLQGWITFRHFPPLLSFRLLMLLM